MANCYRLLDDGTFAQGINFERNPEIGLNITIGWGKSASNVLFYDHPDSGRPICQQWHIFDARPWVDDRGNKYVTGRGSWEGALLSVRTYRLEFNTLASTYFGEICNAYCGIEVMGQPFLQFRARGHADQKQLLILEDGETVFAADRGARYIQIVCKNGVLYTSPADRGDLARFFVARAANLHTHEGLMWTWHALKTLGMEDLWTSHLAERLDELSESRVRVRRRSVSYRERIRV